MKRQLSEWRLTEIESLIRKYRVGGLTSGGAYSLAELELERMRRAQSPYKPRELAERVIALASASPDYRVTYGQLWSDLHGQAAPWGRGWVKPLTDGLGQLGVWCHDNGLPILSVLVVNAGARELSSAAATNIWSYLRAADPTTSENCQTFVKEQTALAQQLTMERLGRVSALA